MPTAYWTPEVMTMAINTNTRMTFYARYGDYLGKIALYMSAALVVVFFAAILLNKRKRLRIKKKNNQE